jgi:hypothetical protein
MKMNGSISRNVRIGLLASSLGVSSVAFADTLILSNHNANAGPKHEAMAHCLEAVKREVGDGHMLVFQNQVTTARTSSGGQAVLVGATIWDNGARVPIEGRCEKGPAGQVVASITRVQNGPANAVAGQ